MARRKRVWHPIVVAILVLLLACSALPFIACSDAEKGYAPASVSSATPTPTPTPTPNPCYAGFFAEPTQCDGPTMVQLTDQSTGNITAWEWDLNGDGITDSTTQNPIHKYDTNGSYSVTLTITGPGCEDTLTKPDYINATGCST